MNEVQLAEEAIIRIGVKRDKAFQMGVELDRRIERCRADLKVYCEGQGHINDAGVSQLMSMVYGSMCRRCRARIIDGA